MPHYPDEIEYSDKYMDDYYEYRHVILPREVYKKMPRGRLLVENVSIIWCRNGEPWESSSQEVGSTMSSTDQNPTSFSLEEPKVLTLKLVCLQLVLSLLPILLPIDLNYICTNLYFIPNSHTSLYYFSICILYSSLLYKWYRKYSGQ